MNFHTITIGEREFESRLTTREVVSLEQKLGTNPLNVLMSMEDGGLPQTGVLLIILQAAAKEDKRKIKLDDWYDLYDEYLAEGNSIADLLNEVMETFKVSGLIPETDETPEEGK